MGPDTAYGSVCRCRPGVPFTPPYVCMSIASAARVRGRCLTRRRPLTYDPALPPPGWGESYFGPPGRPEGRDGILCHSPPHISRDECPCGTPCLCAIEFRRDGRFSLAAPGLRLEVVPRRRQTGDTPAPLRSPRGLLSGCRVLAMPPTALSLSLTGTLSRDASMRPSTRCVACVRVPALGEELSRGHGMGPVW